MKNEKNASPKVIGKENLRTTEEKAQFEVFQRGDLSRDTISKWLRNDIESVASLLHAIRSDEKLFDAVVEHFYERYQSLTKPVEE